MSYPQFGYTYTSSSPLLQMSSQHSPTSCCESGRPIMTDPHTGQTVCSCQVDSRLLSYPRLATGLPVGGIYSSAYSDQGYVSFGADPSAFYSPLNNSYDLKDGSPAAWSSLTQAAAYYSYDPTMAAYPYSNGYGGVDLNGAARRKNATKEVTSTLKAWLYEHRKNPYPTKGEKIMLAIITKMTLTQVSTWFANARRRLKKENKMTWEPRNRVDDDEKSDIENDNDAKDCPDSGSKDDKYKVGDSHKLHDLCDKTQDSDDLLNKNCAKDSLDDLDGDSRSSSPASPLSLSSHTGLSQSSLGGLSDPSPSPDLSSIKTDQNSNKPRIWSLAHTATSNSPPLCRKSPPPPSSLHGLTGATHMPQSHISPHSAAGARGMTMSSMGTSHQTAAGHLASRPDLRTWIEGAFHGASALTAMGIAAQYHGLVSSANSLGVHSTQTNNVCVGNGAAAAAMASQGPAIDRVGVVGTMGPMAANHNSSSITTSTHVGSMNSSRPPIVTTGLDTNNHPHSNTASLLSCRLPPPNTGLKVGVGLPSTCNSVNSIGQTSLFASVKSGLCSLSGDRVGLHTGLTNVNRTTSQTEVLNTAFRPVTKT